MQTNTAAMPASRYSGWFIWVLRLIAAGLMLQTLFFKFSGAEESVYIFTTLGVEPWGRIGTGIMELLASLLLLWPRTTAFGALLGAGIMGGALASHALVLGWEIMGDGGQLVAYATIILLACLLLLLLLRAQWLPLVAGWLPRRARG